MKISTLRKLRAYLLRRRDRYSRDVDKEQYSATNLYRPRLVGRIEEIDMVVDDVDRLIRSHLDKLHDRRSR